MALQPPPQQKLPPAMGFEQILQMMKEQLKRNSNEEPNFDHIGEEIDPDAGR